MELTDLEELRYFIDSNKVFITCYRKKEISNKHERAMRNIKDYSGIDLPDYINDIYDVLSILDPNGGICNREGCSNRTERKAGDKWVLKKFCSRKCADLDFSKKQRGDLNSFHNITNDSRRSMGEKISEKIIKRIEEGSFTPNITNSWCNSKIKILIKGENKFVRSSWEAYFYIMNPDLYYELIRIPYFDKKSGKIRNYITDFCDPINKIIYEIKPTRKINEVDNKINSAIEWCKKNNYDYKIITQKWIIEKYDRSILDGQPYGERIAFLIEKMIKYEN